MNELLEKLERNGFEQIDAITWVLMFPDGDHWIKVTKELDFFEVNFNDANVIYQGTRGLIEGLDVFEKELDT